MRRFWLAMIVALTALRATSLTSVTCTVGTSTQTVTDPTSSSCLIPPGPPQVPQVGADAAIKGSFDVTADAFAASTPDVEAGAEAFASDSETFVDKSRKRFGLIQFDITFLDISDTNGTAVLTDGVHTYSFSPLEGDLYLLLSGRLILPSSWEHCPFS